MKQMNIDEHDIVPLDYDAPGLSRPVKEFRPTLYKKEEAFCCVLGPDPDHAIIGYGATEDEAIAEWNKAFKERLHSKGKDDELLQYIRDTLATSVDDVW